ncbi:MAG TPA: UDP-N-acetylmuramate dehydrogenase [Candidatus Paceibacterota bacterium]|nr:UDP-N-acetylmuramate dehydrogenase [Candidatus Paceibacterota bacterium]
MTIEEQVPFAALTTFKVGGPARYVLGCESMDDLESARAFIRARGLPFVVLGDGSNMLASDSGYAGAVVRIALRGKRYEEQADGSVTATYAAGESWDALVREAARGTLWGIENLAGIPGTVGAAPIQNIGAYGAEVRQTIVRVEAFDMDTGEAHAYSNEECAFAYRESRFKRERNLIITGVAFRLDPRGAARLAYGDLERAKEDGVPLGTPEDVGAAVRAIRARKFPDIRITGTAGSFFKNPAIPRTQYEELLERYPELPGYPAGEEVKVALAYILDQVLGLKGYRFGNARLFEAQPLVLVAEEGATAFDIDMLANEVHTRVMSATGISIEREVRSL